MEQLADGRLDRDRPCVGIQSRWPAPPAEVLESQGFDLFRYR